MKIVAGESPEWYNYACYINGNLIYWVNKADDWENFAEVIQTDSAGKPEPGNGGGYRTTMLYGKIELVHLPTLRKQQEDRQLKFKFMTVTPKPRDFTVAERVDGEDLL